MSSGRRATRPVRQLSLQQPAPRRQHIRRQKSAEDDCSKSLQIYANPIARDRLATNAADKPKVRVAWGDDRRGCDGLAQVEVVARQIPSRSRPTTGRSSRAYATEKASILYSRQELAERLRLAWKHREQNKANIDIFLAHNVAVEERCESGLSMSTPPTPLSRKEIDLMQDEERSPRNLKISGNLGGRGKESREIDHEDEKECQGKLEITPGFMDNDLINKDENVTKSVEKKGLENEKTTNTQINSDVDERKKKTRINIDCTNLHLSTNNQSHPSVTFPSLKLENADSAKINDNFSSAKQKRASFQNGANRAFLIPMTEKIPKETTEAKDKIASAKSIEIRCASAATRSPVDRNIVFARSSSTISLEKTRRTNSAPPQRRNAAPGTRVQVNIVIDTPGLAEATDKSTACRKLQDEKDAVEKLEEGLTKISRSERSIRSAPLKKRSRSAKRRLLASGKDEDRGGRGKSSMDPRTSDVITMVSLVSSADSDSDAENSPGDDKLINELRNKLPTTPIIKTSLNLNTAILRKPIKSVSFQRDSFDEEPTKDEKRVANNVQSPYFGFALNVAHGNGCKDSSDQDLTTDDVVASPALTAVPAFLISQDAEKEVPEAPLTDREKRCLAVPIGDLHDKKRKLLRTRNIPSRPTKLKKEMYSDDVRRITESTNNIPMETKEQRSCLAMSRIDLVAVPIPPIDIPLSKVEHFSKETLPTKETPREMMPSEPHFQTTKEKECWHLYRRMCDKGVCVSFDTVLRGMLTPTEYRLRQKECSQDLR